MMSDYMRRVGRCWNCMALAVAMATGGCLLNGCSRDDGNLRDASGDKASYAALKAENEALRRENQMLRRELISKNGALPDSVMPEVGVARDGGLEPADKETLSIPPVLDAGCATWARGIGVSIPRGFAYALLDGGMGRDNFEKPNKT